MEDKSCLKSPNLGIQNKFFTANYDCAFNNNAITVDTSARYLLGT